MVRDICGGRFLPGRFILAVVFLYLCCYAEANEPVRFDYDAVREKARALAATDYHAPANDDLPDFLKKLTYDSYQQIRFRENDTFWAGEPLRFAVQFFHRGYLYQDSVKIHIIQAGKVQEVSFSPDLFDYGTNRFANPVPTNLDFAGFKLLYPVNVPQKRDEVASFLGGSYFRVLGRCQRYGTSLRGLAINTAESGGEEFPRFTEFWIEKPPQLAAGIRIYALMDSPSVTGRYSFTVEPGGGNRWWGTEGKAMFRFARAISEGGGGAR